MLTIEALKSDSKIAGANIPDDVLQQIATLSKNDEAATIGQKIGETFGMVDSALAEVLGTKKPDGIKTTEFIRNTFQDLKAKADAASGLESIQAERDKLKAEVEDLQTKIREGKGGEALAGQLQKLEAKVREKDRDVAALQKQLQDKEAEFETELKAERGKLVGITFDAAANDFFASLNFDPKLPKFAVEMAKERAKAEVLKKANPDLMEGKLVFRDESGVLNNPQNALQPFSFGELAFPYLKEAIVAEGGGGGGGTKPGGQGAGGASGFSIAGLKSKSEVSSAIKKQLAAEGLSVTSPDYQKRFDEMYSTEGVAELPLS